MGKIRFTIRRGDQTAMFTDEITEEDYTLAINCGNALFRLLSPGDGIPQSEIDIVMKHPEHSFCVTGFPVMGLYDMPLSNLLQHCADYLQVPVALWSPLAGTNRGVVNPEGKEVWRGN